MHLRVVLVKGLTNSIAQLHIEIVLEILRRLVVP
jgi:hypothetical protein